MAIKAINKKLIARYANVFLAHAMQSESLEQLNDGVAFLQNMFRDNPSLGGVLHNPTIPRSEKEKILEKLCKNDISPLLWRFLKIIIEQRQVEQIKEILSVFLVEYRSYIGIQSAVLTTTVPLTEVLLERFIEEVKQLKGCKEVLLEQHIDPSIIGGYILQIGTLKLDRSVKHQLNLLKNSFC